MYSLAALVTDSVVRVGTSQFPVDVAVDSFGSTSCRFMLMKVPDADFWVAGAWRNSNNGQAPEVVALEQVRSIDIYNARRIQLTLETGSIMVVTPSYGCGGCNAVLRGYNPFGAQISLASVPVPRP